MLVDVLLQGSSPAHWLSNYPTPTKPRHADLGFGKSADLQTVFLLACGGKYKYINVTLRRAPLSGAARRFTADLFKPWTPTYSNVGLRDAVVWRGTSSADEELYCTSKLLWCLCLFWTFVNNSELLGFIHYNITVSVPTGIYYHYIVISLDLIQFTYGNYVFGNSNRNTHISLDLDLVWAKVGHYRLLQTRQDLTHSFLLSNKGPHRTKKKVDTSVLEGCGETKVFPVSLSSLPALWHSWGRGPGSDTEEEGSADSFQFRPSGVQTHWS